MIHSYGKRTIRNRVTRQIATKTETRDAILWDVDTDRRVCHVKIQGSSKKIEARYPENWQSTPPWLKPGNAVKILHTSGNRNHIEIIGNGLYVPTPEPDESAAPAVELAPDCVMTGCLLHALPGVKRMQIYVETGTYRISNAIYALGSMLAADDNICYADSSVPIDQTAEVLAIAAASSINRIDAVAVGVDGVIDVITGSVELTAPDTPDGHVLLGVVSVPPGTTEITNFMVNGTLEYAALSSITVSPTTIDLPYNTEEVSFTVSVTDQYGNNLTGGNYHIQAQITSGTGTILSLSRVVRWSSS